MDRTDATLLCNPECSAHPNIQLFQLTLSDQSIKLEDKTARLCGIFFWINSWKPAMPRPYSQDLWWRAIWMKEIPGYQVDEVATVSRFASLGVRPYKKTSVFRSCVNWLVNLSSDEGDTNENITWKHKIIGFVLFFSITLTRLFSTEMADYPVTKLVKNSPSCVHVLNKTLNFSSHVDVLQRMATKCNKI